MQYYPVVKNWRKIKPHLQDEELKKILVNDFNKYTYGRWEELFLHGMFPADFESCDWRLDRKGRHPEFWNYVKHAACHWLVNFNYRLAKLTEPKIDWRIVEGDLHSTVWDGEETLWDFNFLALEVDPDEAFDLANTNGIHTWDYIELGFADHCSTE